MIFISFFFLFVLTFSFFLLFLLFPPPLPYSIFHLYKVPLDLSLKNKELYLLFSVYQLNNRFMMTISKDFEESDPFSHWT